MLAVEVAAAALVKRVKTLLRILGGDGGDGTANSITGSSVYYAGGGGGGSNKTDGGDGGLGGVVQERMTEMHLPQAPLTLAASGGGVTLTLLRGGRLWRNNTKTQSTASATTGSPTTTTDGSYNIYTFTGSGSITF